MRGMKGFQKGEYYPPKDPLAKSRAGAIGGLSKSQKKLEHLRSVCGWRKGKGWQERVPPNGWARCKSCNKYPGAKPSPTCLEPKHAQNYLRHLKIIDAPLEAAKKQVGPCAICNLIRNLVPDHNHYTGKFRGLICQPCNQLLGFLESPKLSLALKYLKEHDSNALLFFLQVCS